MKPEQQKNLLYILIPSGFVMLVWLILGIYNKSISSTITKPQSLLITPISSTFESGVLTDLKKRNTISPDFDLTGQSTQSPAEPQPSSAITTTEAEQASPSAVEGQ